MRWTIPTLMQQLVDQNVPITRAVDIVAATYPETAGDTFYRRQLGDDPKRVAVGVYGLWNSLRGDQSPLGGAKVSDDARTIAQFLRLDGRSIRPIVYDSGVRDHAITTICQRTADAMRAGDYFEPQQVDVTVDRAGFLTDLQRTVADLDGAADYLTSIPKPRFDG